MTFEDIGEGKAENLVNILNQLRSFMLSLNPVADERILGGKAVRMASYSLGNRNNFLAVYWYS